MISKLRMLICVTCVIQLKFICSSYVDYKTGSFQFNGTRVGNRQTVKFTCECSQLPIEGAILFQVNSNTVDVIRLKNNRCYDRYQECRTDICLCSYDGIKFQMEYWYHILNISESYNFGVEILLKDSNANIVTVTLSRFYNGKDFEKLEIVKEINQHKFIEKTEETGNDLERGASKETLLKFLSASVCLILMVGCVLCICRYNVFGNSGPDVYIKPFKITKLHRGLVAKYCTVKSDIPVKEVTWHRVKGDAMTQVAADGSKCSVTDEYHSLTVNGTNFEDEGFYVCTAESDASNKSISNCEITAKPGPDEIIKTQIITVSHREPVAIYCTVMSDLPVKEVIWYRVKEDSMTPVAVDNSKCSVKDEHHRLAVYGTNFEDEGFYVCKCTAERVASNESISSGDIVVTEFQYREHIRDLSRDFTLRYGNELKPKYYVFLGKKDRVEKIDVDNMSSGYYGASLHPPFPTVVDLVNTDKERFSIFYEPKPRCRTNDSDEEKVDSSSHIYNNIQEKYETYTKPIDKDECEPAESKNTASSDKSSLPKRPPPPSRPLRPQLEEKGQIRNDDDIKQMASLYGRRVENEIRLVMVGRTRSGKSATGYTIMDHFESKLAGGSVTCECKRGECNKAGRKIVLVDTPCLFDAPQKHKDFIKRCPGRYLAIIKKASEKKKAAKVTNLFQLVDEMYKEAAAALQRKIKELEEEKAQEKKKEIDQIQSKFTHQIDSIKKDNTKLAKEVSSIQMAQRQFQREKEKAKQETIRMKEEMKKIDKKRNEEIYLIKKKEKEEKEKQARDLEQKERHHLQLLQSMQQQQAETSRRYQDMERKKELQLSKVTEDHNKRMEAEIQRIVDGSDEKYKNMIQPLEAKDKGYDKLQEQMAQQNSKMQELMREKDRDFLKQQEENRKRIEQEKDRSNETLRMQLDEQKRSMDSTRDIILQEQKERDQRQREEYQELKRQYKRTQEQMKNKGCMQS